MQTTKPRSMANSRLDANKVLRSGVFVLGDALNMRHPLTGGKQYSEERENVHINDVHIGGMTVGLSDAVLVRDLLAQVSDFKDTQAVTNKLQQFYNKRKGYSATTNILAGALYQVFTASNGIFILLIS